MLAITKTRTEMKNAFDGLISRLNMAEKRISELENMTIETSKTEKQREKKKKPTAQNIQKLWGNYKKCNIYMVRLSKEEKGVGGKKQYMKEYWLINFLQINVRH